MFRKLVPCSDHSVTKTILPYLQSASLHFQLPLVAPQCMTTAIVQVPTQKKSSIFSEVKAFYYSENLNQISSCVQTIIVRVESTVSSHCYCDVVRLNCSLNVARRLVFELWPLIWPTSSAGHSPSSPGCPRSRAATDSRTRHCVLERDRIRRWRAVDRRWKNTDIVPLGFWVIAW